MSKTQVVEGKAPDDIPPGVKGVVVVLTGPNSREIANASDFDPSRFGGFSLAQSQRVRVRRHLAGTLVRTYCADFIASSMDVYDTEQLLERVLRREGYALHYVAVGHHPEELR